MTWEVRVAEDIAVAAADLFLQQRPQTVVLAGGQTPRPLYTLLAQKAQQHDWASVDVFFSDERCVPPDHPDSNYRMAHETLLSRVSARVHRMPGETCDVAAYEAELRGVFGDRTPDFDLAFLGIGADGHTASLFPGDPALLEEHRWVVEVTASDHHRLSLTLPSLSASKLVVFLVAGADKRPALTKALAGGDVPAARVKAQRAVVIADRAAAPEHVRSS